MPYCRIGLYSTAHSRCCVQGYGEFFFFFPDIRRMQEIYKYIDEHLPEWRILQVLAAAISLRARYAMPGTDVLNGYIGPRARYGIAGTDIAYGAIGLRTRYAMPGTDSA
eukprot:3251839-Rhodomonas_salina.1